MKEIINAVTEVKFIPTIGAFREKLHDLSKETLFKVCIHDLKDGIVASDTVGRAVAIDETILRTNKIPDPELEKQIYGTAEKVQFLSHVFTSSIQVLSQARQILENTPEMLSEESHDLLTEWLDKTKDKEQLAPILIGSSLLMIKPTLRNAAMLYTQRVDAALIARIVNISVDFSQTVLLNGMDANIVYNAAKNARISQQGTTARMSLNLQGGLVIENFSSRDLPPNYEVFGVKGENGNTGFGMSIMALYSGLQGRKLNVDSQALGTNFRIRVTIPR